MGLATKNYFVPSLMTIFMCTFVWLKVRIRIHFGRLVINKAISINAQGFSEVALRSFKIVISRQSFAKL